MPNLSCVLPCNTYQCITVSTTVIKKVLTKSLRPLFYHLHLWPLPTRTHCLDYLSGSPINNYWVNDWLNGWKSALKVAYGEHLPLISTSMESRSSTTFYCPCASLQKVAKALSRGTKKRCLELSVLNGWECVWLERQEPKKASFSSWFMGWDHSKTSHTSYLHQTPSHPASETLKRPLQPMDSQMHTHIHLRR